MKPKLFGSAFLLVSIFCLYLIFGLPTIGTFGFLFYVNAISIALGCMFVINTQKVQLKNRANVWLLLANIASIVSIFRANQTIQILLATITIILLLLIPLAYYSVHSSKWSLLDIVTLPYQLVARFIRRKRRQSSLEYIVSTAYLELVVFSVLAVGIFLGLVLWGSFFWFSLLNSSLWSQLFAFEYYVLFMLSAFGAILLIIFYLTSQKHHSSRLVIFSQKVNWSIIISYLFFTGIFLISSLWLRTSIGFSPQSMYVFLWTVCILVTFIVVSSQISLLKRYVLPGSDFIAVVLVVILFGMINADVLILRLNRLTTDQTYDVTIVSTSSDAIGQWVNQYLETKEKLEISGVEETISLSATEKKQIAQFLTFLRYEYAQLSAMYGSQHILDILEPYPGAVEPVPVRSKYIQFGETNLSEWNAYRVLTEHVYPPELVKLQKFTENL